MSRDALARIETAWAPQGAPRRHRRRARLAPAHWPGDVTPEAGVAAELPRWINERARPPVTLLAMIIGGVLLADLSAMLFLLGS